MRRVLLVYPEYPRNTYWSFSGALPYIGRRASMPPLGLITVAALLPAGYEARLVDMNVGPLTDDDLYWADLVFTSTMIVQAPSLAEVIRRAGRIGVPVVAGGPHPSSAPEGVPGADHLLAGEAEVTLPRFLADLEAGAPRPVYRTEELPELSTTPPPRYDLLRRDAYASMAVQYSRGCPFTCDFCDIWKLYGRRPRVKGTDQFLHELDRLHDAGWRGSVFIVDDNFIGNPRALRPFLIRLAEWQSEHGYPFDLFTEASVNLASHGGLLRGMREAGFSMVFLGIETPSAESLAGSNKMQNLRTDLKDCVRRIQAEGMEVAGGFIVGFDNDRPDIFERQARFIEATGIPMAMVGVLTALPGTDLHRRLERAGRLLGSSGGNNTHTFRANFTTRLPRATLAAGYRRLIGSLYDPSLRNYFRRCRTLLRRWGPGRSRRALRWRETRALLRSLAVVPARSHGWQYGRFLIWSLIRRARHFPEAVRLGIMGFHFRAITRGALATEDLRRDFVGILRRMRRRAGELRAHPGDGRAARARARRLHAERRRVLRGLRRRVRRLDSTFRPAAERDYAAFLARLDDLLGRAVPAPYRTGLGGRELLDEIRGFFVHEEESFAARCRELRERTAQGLDDLGQAARKLCAEKRHRLRAARQRLRELPSEYRRIARREYDRLRASLSLMAATDLPPGPAASTTD